MRRRRCLALSVASALVILIAAMPVAALAAETGAESPGGPTEPASPTEAPPASTGWVPQGTGTEASGGGATPIHHGSSLGSGGRPTPAAPTSEEPSYSAPEASSGYESESASSPAPTPEEARSTAPEASGVEAVEPPPVERAAPRKVGRAAVGTATPLTPPDKLEVAGVHSASPSKTAVLTGQGDGVGSGPNALWWLAIIICALVMIYAAGRLLLEPTEPFKRGRPGRRPRAG